jgi:phosphotransferase system IIB component
LYRYSKAEDRLACVLRLTLEVQDRDKALAEASKARDGVMAQGKDSLSRVRWGSARWNQVDPKPITYSFSNP